MANLVTTAPDGNKHILYYVKSRRTRVLTVHHNQALKLFPATYAPFY